MKEQTKFLEGLVGLLLMAIVLLVMLLSGCMPVFAQSKPTISISSTGTPLQTSFGVNMPDMSFTGKASKGNYFDINTQPYLSNFRAIGFTNGTVLVAGSRHKYMHPNMNSTVPGNGYNSKSSDFTKAGTDDRTSYDQGCDMVNWSPHDFVIDGLTFCKNQNYLIDHCANVFNGNWTELKWYLDHYNLRRVILGAEQVTFWNIHSYMDSCRKWIPLIRRSYPNVIICADAAPIYRGSKNTQAWNDSVATLQVDEADSYIQYGDIVTYTANPRQNVDSLNWYFNLTLPNQFVNYSLQFAALKLNADEWQVEDNRNNIQYVNNTPVAAWAIGRGVETFVNNTSLISEVEWMSGAPLVDQYGNYSNNALAIKQCSQLWKGNDLLVGTITFSNMTGVTGAITYNSSGHNLLLNNSSDSDYTVNKLTVDGKAVKSFSRSTLYALTWDGGLLGEAAAESKIIIRAHSTSVVTW